MKGAAEIIAGLRRREGLAQRTFATKAGMSFRQVQRIEKGESDITLSKLIGVVRRFGMELALTEREPRWDALAFMGMPLETRARGTGRCSRRSVDEAVVGAIRFLSRKDAGAGYGRHRDAFKALLLTLATHYPSRFAEYARRSGVDVVAVFGMDVIAGKDIKLRNLCLPALARWCKSHAAPPRQNT